MSDPKTAQIKCDSPHPCNLTTCYSSNSRSILIKHTSSSAILNNPEQLREFHFTRRRIQRLSSFPFPFPSLSPFPTRAPQRRHSLNPQGSPSPASFSRSGVSSPRGADGESRRKMERRRRPRSANSFHFSARISRALS